MTVVDRGQTVPGEGASAARWGPPPAPRPSGRANAVLTWLLALVLVVVVAAGVAFVVGQAPAQAPAGPPAAVSPPSPSVAQAPVVDPVVEREAAVVELLDRRAAALLARDPAGWMADVDPASADFAARQSAVLANLTAVPVAAWRYDFAGAGIPPTAERKAVLGEDSWVARVILVYRLADADSADVRRELNFTVVHRGGRWLLADDVDGPTATDVWDLGPVQVVRGSRSLVLGTGDAGSLKRYAEMSDAAAERVDVVWGEEWPRVVVVVVPRDQSEMARLLQRADQAGLEQIAAVTTGEVGLGDGESADRVIINPAGFEELESLGRDVVLTHEVTHVATRATGTVDVPIWLSEGFADYVAYSGTELSRRTVAADVLDLVRTGSGPATLPDVVAFDPAQGNIASAYSGAWLAAELIARTWGEQTLVKFYRQVAGVGAAGAPAATAPVDEAFRQVLGTDQATFEQRWRDYLVELAE